jgi:hypothetical protein
VAFHETLKYRWAPFFFAELFVYLGACLAKSPAVQRPGCPGLSCVESGMTKTLDNKGDSTGPIRSIRPTSASRPES